MKAIIAMSENRAIGLNGKIPWHVSADFKWFKEFTMGKTLIVGRTTFDTLPLLKGRNVVVLATKLPVEDHYPYTKITNQNGMEGTVPWCGLLKWMAEYKRTDFVFTKNQGEIEDYVIAGGKKTYEFFMPYITEFYVTHIKGTYDADTYMIPFEHLYNKQEVIKEFDGHRVIKYTK